MLSFTFLTPFFFGVFFIQLYHFPSASHYAAPQTGMSGRNEALSHRTHQTIKTQAQTVLKSHLILFIIAMIVII